MNRLIKAGARSGQIEVPPSKAYAHRMLICAAFADKKSSILCDGISDDIMSTIRCLSALGAGIDLGGGRIRIEPIGTKRLCGKAELYCGESGATLRFLMPIVGALGADAVFHLEGRLPKRPLTALAEELKAHGMNIERDGDRIFCSGQLRAGSYRIDGGVSSQFASGLLLALPLLDGDSEICIEGDLVSVPYIEMTLDVLRRAEADIRGNGRVFEVVGGRRYGAFRDETTPRDWSSAAAFLCMGALSEEGITVAGMDTNSKQGDMEIVDILRKFGAEIEVSGGLITARRGGLRGQVVDAADIPDLVPVLSAVAAAAEGETRIVNAGRLKYKESDRLIASADMLRALGADIEATGDGLVIVGKPRLEGGSVNSAGDHRIAMAAAVAACACRGDVEIIGAECVGKSYPDFWNDFETLEVL